MQRWTRTLGELADVVAGQLGDKRVELEEKGQGLANASSSTEHGDLEVGLHTKCGFARRGRQEGLGLARTAAVVWRARAAPRTWRENIAAAGQSKGERRCKTARRPYTPSPGGRRKKAKARASDWLGAESQFSNVFSSANNTWQDSRGTAQSGCSGLRQCCLWCVAAFPGWCTR